MRVSTGEITFRIDIDFEGADVDMVYKEMAGRGVQSSVPCILTDAAQIRVDDTKLAQTPTESSVDFCLQWLAGYVNRNTHEINSSKWDKDYSKMITAVDEDGVKYSAAPKVQTELEKIGLSVESTYGLMMGTCHLICSCPAEKYSPALVKKAEVIVKKVFTKFIQYYG